MSEITILDDANKKLLYSKVSRRSSNYWSN